VTHPTIQTTDTARADRPDAEPRYLPLGINVAGLRCLVVGGGRVGARKARTLVDAGARVTVVSPDIADRLRPLVDEGRVIWQQGRYVPDSIDGHTLVVAATDDPALNLQIGRDAQARSTLSCLVSPGRDSRVIFPATHTDGDVTVAVHSNGRDCSQSRAVRDEIARLLQRRGRPPLRFAVFGVDRADLPRDTFDRLRSLSGADLRGTDAVLLATCCRWEWYVAAPSLRPVIHDILALVERRCGLLLDAHRPAFYTKVGVAAWHHLLRVASGLESPLLGESEIVGQIRTALRDASLPADGPVARAFRSALQEQKSVRAEAGLAAERTGWAQAAVTALAERLGSLADRTVALYGCGRLSRGIAARLVARGAVVSAFSKRASHGGVPWCREQGIDVSDPAELWPRLSGIEAVILSSWPDGGVARLRGAGAPLVLDFTGRGRADATWCGPAEIGGVPRTGREVARAAHAGCLAFATALRLHRAGRPPHEPTTIRAGARGSRLSRAQIAELAAFLDVLLPGTQIDFAPVETPGDRDRRTPLPAAAGDFFTRDLDRALLRGRVDLSVHSAKDLPERIPDGLRIAAVTPAFAPWDVLVARDGLSLNELPRGARVGTSSDRRREALLALRPDLVAADIRGNVPDRIRQLDAGRYSALVLAAIGLTRLGLADRITQVFSPREVPIAPGQGSLALLVREDDADLLRLLEPLDLGDRRGLPWA
jgi:hydroxymethylbilane synthase